MEQVTDGPVCKMLINVLLTVFAISEMFSISGRINLV